MKLRNIAALLGVGSLALSAFVSPAMGLPPTNNAGTIDYRDLTIAAFDTQQATGEAPGSGKATAAIDGKVNTYWHSQWDPAEPNYPHWVTVKAYDGENIKSCSITGLRYFQKQGASGGGAKNGIVKGYEIYATDAAPGSNADISSGAVAKGDFTDTDSAQTITFAAQNSRYITLKATSPLNPAHKWAAVGEIELIGSCTSNDSKTLVRPVKPTQSADNASVEIPAISGVTYKLNGTVVSGKVTLATGENKIIATPKDGYKFPEKAQAQSETFTFNYEGAPIPVTIPQTSNAFQRATGSWTLLKNAQVVRPDSMAARAELLVNELNAYLKSDSVTGVTAGTGIKLLTDSSRTDLKNEGYELTITPSGVTITAATDIGVFYGTRTLSQMLRQQTTLPAGTVKDIPAYAERGMTLCACQINMSNEWIDRFLTEMADLKLNQVLLEMKLKSEKHPDVNTWSYYTREDVAKFVKKANTYGIDVIPEINSPGHMNIWLENKPEFQLRNNAGEHQPNQLDLSNPQAVQFYLDLIDEYDGVFNTKYWHVGADEYMIGTAFSNYNALTNWAKQTYGTKATIGDAFIAFINNVNKHIKAKGKTLRMWNDGYIETEVVKLDKDIIIEYWLGSGRTVNAVANDGYKLMNAHNSWYWSRAADYPMQNNINHAYNLAPNQFTGGTLPKDSPLQTGVKASIWPDSGVAMTENEVEVDIFPGMRVMAQIAWYGGKASDSANYSQFKANRIDKISRSPEWENINRAPIDLNDGNVYQIKTTDGKQLSLIGENPEIGKSDAFELTHTPDGYYQLKSITTQKCLSVVEGDSHLGTVTQVGAPVQAVNCVDVSPAYQGEGTARRPSGYAQRNPQKWQLLADSKNPAQFIIRNAVTLQHLAVATGKEAHHVDFRKDNSRAPKAMQIVQLPLDMTSTKWTFTKYNPAFSAQITVDQKSVVTGDDASVANVRVTVTNTSQAPLKNLKITPAMRNAGWELTPAVGTIAEIPVGQSKDIEFKAKSTWKLGPKEFVFTVSDGITERYLSTAISGVCKAQKVVPMTIGGSSEEATGEGPNNGHYSHAADNNINTFWHSRWSAPAATYPHWIDLKLDKKEAICGLEYQGRQGNNANGRVKDFELYLSDTQENLGKGEPALKSNFLNTADSQTAPLIGTGQYIRFKGLNAHNNGDASVMSVAELKVLLGTVPAQPKAATPVEPKWDDQAGSYTITAVEGIIYKVDGKVVSGKVSVTPPETVTVTAEAASGYYIPDDASITFKHSFQKVVSPLAPKFDDKKFTYTIPDDPYFIYSIGSVAVKAGEYTANPKSEIKIDASLKNDLGAGIIADSKVVSWQHLFPDKAGTQPPTPNPGGGSDNPGTPGTPNHPNTPDNSGNSGNSGNPGNTGNSGNSGNSALPPTPEISPDNKAESRIAKTGAQSVGGLLLVALLLSAGIATSRFSGHKRN